MTPEVGLVLLLFTDASRICFKVMMGISAEPGMEFYARRIAELAPSAPEHEIWTSETRRTGCRVIVS